MIGFRFYFQRRTEYWSEKLEQELGSRAFKYRVS